MDKELKKILKRCLKKDRRAQFKLYHRSYGFLMSICMRYQKNRDEAEALLNEGFLKVLLNLDSYDFDREYQAWASTIMIRTAIDQYRAEKSYQQNTDLQEDEAVLERESLSAKHMRMVHEMTQGEIAELIQSLPDSLRLVFNLYELEGYQHQEIADMLDISLRSSKRYLKQAKNTLKERLEQNAQLKKVI